MYGIIVNGKLVIVEHGSPDAKPVLYEDVPKFDQCTHYVRQQDPVDVGSHLFVGAELMELDQDDTDPDGAPY